MNWKATLLAKFRSHLKLDYFDYIRVAESYRGVQVSQVMEILTPIPPLRIIHRIGWEKNAE